jgi:hypothetical protein
MTRLRIFLGWDVREMRAWNVAQMSLKMHASTEVHISRLALSELRNSGLYRRPTDERDGKLWDVISDAPMSTGHAISRFLVPHLCGYYGWALFTDGDVLFRDDVAKLFALADDQYAVQVVHHQHAPVDTVKKGGHVQTAYPRKNWSSVMLFNCGHPANLALTVELVNTVPGRDLHRFCWLEDAQIGALPARWNLLVGHSAYDQSAALVHFTEGVPDVPGYEHVPYADEWRTCARGAGYRFQQPIVDERVIA